MVVAIDGPAGSGKSTIAKLLAKKLNFTFVNSGNLYRAITLYCLQNQIDMTDGQKTLDCAQKAVIDYKGELVILNGVDVTSKLHSDSVDANVALLSSNVKVRHLVNGIIKRISNASDIVVEGRDMTSVVFPDAQHRFFLDASVDVRAKRRLEQGVSGLTFEQIKESIKERDAADKNKPEGRLILDKGVCYIDGSVLTIEDVFGTLLNAIKNKGKCMNRMESAKETSSSEIQSKLQEEYLKQLEQLEEGQLVDGLVVQISREHVFIDVGYKSEGRIPVSEFSELPKVGDKVSVVLVTKENKHGEVIVSKQKADEKLFWKNLRRAFQDKTPVEGVIKKQVKGGFSVQLSADVEAFLPISQADVIRVEKPEKLVGKEVTIFIDRLYSDGKINIIANRRKYLEEDSAKRRLDFFETKQIGDEVSGIVKSFTSFGAFIDLGGFDGLLHVNEMSWGHVARPRDYVKKGQEIKLKVVRLDKEEGHINLSLKHFTDDPWVHFEDKHHVNDVVKGRVTKLAEFGAFIELEEGIEGLAHISDFSWIKKIQKPSDLLNIGDEVECMILGYDLQAGRVSLGLKQITENPWSSIEEKYPIGTRLTRKVVKITGVGAFIQLEDGIDGFLHAEDLSWTKKVKHLQSELQEGKEIDVIVIDCDSKSKHIKLGVKQLEQDPWQNFCSTHKIGSAVEGEVATVTDFGLFLRLPGGIEGLIHKTNLTESKDEDPDEALKKYKEGDKIKAVVVDVQADKQKAAFSIRDYHKKLQKDEISRYMAGNNDSDDGKVTFGDFLKSKEKDAELKDKDSE
ncbi:MAG: 30S ribosomal protein S1 [Spirochaetaceae bacterium]|jgi:small subunit ribosomal protein S1|nr:30S ribosomal protein S1 [Spirochaetaceae bacterium]